MEGPEEETRMEPEPMFNFASAVMDSKLYMYGGFVMDQGPRTNLWSHDLDLHTWTNLGKPPMPFAHSLEEASMVGVDGCLYIAGGEVHSEFGPDIINQIMIVYDTKSDVWSHLTLPVKLTQKKTNLVAFHKHLFLSCEVSATRKLFALDLGSDTWSERASPPATHNLIVGRKSLLTTKAGNEPVVHTLDITSPNSEWTTISMERPPGNIPYKTSAETRTTWNDDAGCLVVFCEDKNVYSLDPTSKQVSHLDKRWLMGEHVHSKGPWILCLGGYLGEPYEPCMWPKRFYVKGGSGSSSSSQKDVEVDPQFQLLASMHSSMQRSEFADVTLIVEGREIPCHRLVLSCASEHFRAMFSSGMQESSTQRVELPNISYATFQYVLCYMYTAKLPSMSDLSLTQTQELLQASKYLLLKELPQQLNNKLIEQLEHSNACSLLQFAESIGSQQLKTDCLQYIHRNYSQILQGRHLETLRTTPELMLEVMYSSAKIFPKKPRLA